VRLSGVVEQLRAWRPGDGPLIDVVRAAGEGARSRASSGWTPSAAWLAGRRRIALDAIPPGLRSATPACPHEDVTELPPAVLNRYLAAHAFANWTVHLGCGLRSWLRSIEVALALVRTGCGIGDADLILRHLADPAALGSACSPAEDEILPSP